MPEGLSFKFRTEGDTVIVTVSGDVDLRNAAELAEHLVSHADSHLVVDMSDVSFLDSKGIEVLVLGYRAQLAAGRRFRTEGERDNVRRVLEIAGLLDLFHGRGLGSDEEVE